MYYRIPKELRDISQWVCWRHETVTNDDGTERATKIPYRPDGQGKASVTDRSNWSSFEQACEAAELMRMSGIGFVFSKEDPYCFIDLDDPAKRGKIEDAVRSAQLNQRIYNQFESYTEMSPSGKGVHIIVRGQIPEGRRRDTIEVYSSERYATFTGQVLRDLPIVDMQTWLNVLYNEMTTQNTSAATQLIQVAGRFSDDEIIRMAMGAVNSDKFVRLCRGEWQDEYPSQSEADFALLSMFAFYTPDNEQCFRLFRTTNLGQRAKAVKDDRYLTRAMQKIRANEPPAVDFSQLKLVSTVAASEALPSSAENATPAGAVPLYSYPPGLLGEVASYIERQAIRPVPEIALCAAIAFVAGVIGRSYNISGTGLNQYIVAVAATGCHARGSEILMADGSIKLVEDIVVGDLLMGPDSIARQVQRLARGRQQMVKIVPVKGESFVVNLDHILSLVNTTTKTVVNITVQDWLSSNNQFKHLHKLRRVGVELQERELSIDPWFLGALLGDGCLVGKVNLTGTKGEGVLERAAPIAESFGLKIRVENNHGEIYHHNYSAGNTGCADRNALTEALRKLNLYGCNSETKFVPSVYKTASRNQRLEMLAGLLDTDGYFGTGTYDYCSKSKQMAEDVKFIARSVGLAAYIRERNCKAQNGSGGVYYAVSISGDVDIVPCVVERKRAPARKQIKSVLVTGFSVELMPDDEFYGFSLDKDHLYLDGNFVVHHNTGKEAAANGIGKLFTALRHTVPNIDKFIGPGVFASGPALVRVLDEQPCFVSTLGEFGLTLQSWSQSTNNPVMVMMRRVLLDIYGKSGHGQIMNGTAYSDKEKNTKTVFSPCMTILGEATPESFYDNLSSSQISEGLIPRFSIVEYTGNRPERNRAQLPSPEPELLRRLSDLAAIGLYTSNNNSVCNVEVSVEAGQLLDAFDFHCDHKIRRGSEVERQLWNRAHLKALKLCGLVAAADAPHAPVVTAIHAKWAIDFINTEVSGVERRFRNNDVGSSDTRVENFIRKMVVDYQSMTPTARQTYGVPEKIAQRADIVPFCFLRRRLRMVSTIYQDRRGAPAAIKSAVQDMLDAGILREVPKAQALAELQSTMALYVVGGSW